MSFTFANLPGVQVTTVDGGLASVNTPTTQSIMVFGTSAIGPANSPYQVVSLATAAQVFGLNGTLIRGMSEVAAYCDNITLFRMGANQGKFTIGATTSGSESTGTVANAYSNAAGTIYTYVFSTPLGIDTVVGSPLTTTGFTPTAFNLAAAPILSVNDTTNTVTVAPTTVPTIPTGGAESFVLSGNATIASGTPNSLATVHLTQTASQIINVGDSITIATATSAALNGTWTVISAVLVSTTWTVTFNVGPTITLASTPQVAGTLVDSNIIAASVLGTSTVTVPANTGLTLTLGQVDSSANTRYKIWYADGIVSLWLDNNIVYSNDPAINVNTGDSSVSGVPTGGIELNNNVAGNPDSLANAITLQAAAALTTVGVDAAPVYIAPTTGIGLSNRALYIAQQNAMNLVQGLPIDIAVTPGAYANNPNVAYYVSSDTTTTTHNPATNPNALDWLWTGVDSTGNPIYQWASETQFYTWDNRTVNTAILRGDTVATTPVVNTFTSATTRLGQGVGSGNEQQNGFHEVHFAYQLARFCSRQSEAPQADNGGCLGFIGTNGPSNLTDFSLASVKNWIGYLPTYAINSAGVSFPTVSGGGLLGIPFLVGASSSNLNQACADFANGFRLPGLFQTASGEYDGGPMFDVNGFPVQFGAYITVHGDYALQSNAYGTYVGNIAGAIAGLVSTMDQLKAVTNKPVAGVAQLYRASLSQLDALTFANINVLRFKGLGQLPVSLHDETAATAASDYTLTMRQRIKFLMIQTLLQASDSFIGGGTNDGMSLTALKTALDANCLNLQKRGYISKFTFTITSTLAQQKVGQANIQVSFVPADELVQLNATIGINLKA